MSRDGAGIAVLIALALSLGACEQRSGEGHTVTGADSEPAPSGHAVLVKSTAPDGSGQSTTPEAAKPQNVERVLAFSYLGDTDRPVFPTLVGNSQAAIGHFLSAHSKDPLIPHGLQVVATAEGMAAIANVLKTAEEKLKPAKSKETAQPLLSVSDWSATAERTAQFPALAGLALLRSAAQCLKKSDAKPAGSLDALIILLSRD
jgi:hypothetical protein